MPSSTAHRLAGRLGWMAGTLSAVLLAAPAAPADAVAVHTRLESSVPAADAVLQTPPKRFELRFTGEIDHRLSAIIIVSPAGDSVSLEVLADAADDRLLVARAPELRAGRYLVRWHTVSADGHPVEGEFTFTIAASSGSDRPPEHDARPDTSGEDGPPTAPRGLHAVEAGDVARTDEQASPLGGTLVAGLALACLLGFAGLLWFAGAGPLLAEARVRSAVTLLGWAAVVLLTVDLAAWLGRVRPPGSGIDGLWHALASSTGLVAFGQLLLAAAAATLLSRSGRLAAVLALLAVLTGAGGGHPAAISPGIAVSANAIHVGAAAIWVGGVLLIALVPDGPADGSGRWTLGAVASSVSAAALFAVLLVVGSGIVQSVIFIGRLDLYATSAYGRTVLLKVAGLLVLVGFGAWHRKRTLPALAGIGEERAGDPRASLLATARLETLVMLIVILIAAYLGRVSPPASP